MAKSLASLKLPFIEVDSQQDDLYAEGKFQLRSYRKQGDDPLSDGERELLKANGIPWETQGINRAKQVLRIGVAQFQSFFIWQISPQKKTYFPSLSPALPQSQQPVHLVLPVNSYRRDIRKCRQLATRTVYALGCDVAVVEVGIFSQKPRYRVINVTDEIPEQVEDDLRRLLEKQERDFYQGAEPVLGADLEFVLRHPSGKFALASNYVPKRGRVGYDAIWLPKQREKHPIVELRPQPHSDPLQLLNHIYACLLLAKKKINHPHLSWLAGGHPLKGFPIGGHIHFSGLPLTSRFIRVLDNYLSLPLFLMESPISLTRRPKYGYLGDVREQFHGGFEYRTPPSWLVRPRVARGILCLSKVLALDYKALEWMPTLRREIQLDFYRGNREKCRPIVQLLWEEMKTRCPSYVRYERELDHFFQLIESGYQWDEYEDFRPWWRIGPV